MITPYEIENIGFSRAVKGYKTEEVDDFLSHLTKEVEQLINENKELNHEVERMKAAIEEHKQSSESVVGTLEAAKSLMNDLSSSAEKRASTILKNAQLEAEVIQREAKESVIRLTQEGEKLRDKVARYEERYRRLLQDQLDQLEGSSEELFADLERDFLPASMEGKEGSSIQKEVAPVTQTIEETETLQVGLDEPETRVSGDESVLDRIMSDMNGDGLDKSKTIVVKEKADLTKTRIL